MYTKNKDIDKFKNYALGPISSYFNFFFICLQLPASVLEDIFIDVVLQEGDEAILTLALVCTRFRDLVTREAFSRRVHFLWLDSKCLLVFFA